MTVGEAVGEAVGAFPVAAPLLPPGRKEAGEAAAAGEEEEAGDAAMAGEAPAAGEAEEVEAGDAAEVGEAAEAGEAEEVGEGPGMGVGEEVGTGMLTAGVGEDRKEMGDTPPCIPWPWTAPSRKLRGAAAPLPCCCSSARLPRCPRIAAAALAGAAQALRSSTASSSSIAGLLVRLPSWATAYPDALAVDGLAIVLFRVGSMLMAKGICRGVVTAVEMTGRCRQS